MRICWLSFYWKLIPAVLGFSSDLSGLFLSSYYSVFLGCFITKLLFYRSICFLISSSIEEFVIEIKTFLHKFIKARTPNFNQFIFMQSIWLSFTLRSLAKGSTAENNKFFQWINFINVHETFCLFGELSKKNLEKYLKRACL